MRPPDFWQRPQGSPGWQARLLTPVASIAATVTARRIAREPTFNPSVPVICIGNLNIGGSGKTPTAIAVAARLQSRGLAVHFVSRGYGGQLAGPTRVNEQGHRAGDVGDEPLLLAAFAPTWIARDRAAGVQAAQTGGADAIILDDGFQNPSVAKDLSIIVVDARRGFGNGRVFPAGPLREPVAVGQKRADLVLAIGNNADQEKFRDAWGGLIDIPVSIGQLAPLKTGMDWDGVDVLAFAGIAHPDKFFETMAGLGANLIRAEALDDHQPLTDRLMRRLAADADALNAQLVTTEKDAVRLPKSFRDTVLTLAVRLEIADWSLIDGELARIGLS